MIKINIASLFSGAGGMDLGFEMAGFNVIWSNEFDKKIVKTHELNFPNCFLDKRSIVNINAKDIPEVSGFIGGPPCQSWSSGGKQNGIEDPRGKLFYEYIRILENKKPLFFIIENVPGILYKKHDKVFNKILKLLKKIGYNISYDVLNANDYNVPQDRKRIFIVGVLKSYKNIKYKFPCQLKNKPTLKDCIFDLKDTAVPFDKKNKNKFNHEYALGGFSPMFMSRNRIRKWNKPSFTIQASARHAPLHPNSPEMIKIDKDLYDFKKECLDKYRRLSVRECARIQTFPDNFIFDYNDINDGYKMIGNAVPVNLAFSLATEIMKQLF